MKYISIFLLICLVSCSPFISSKGGYESPELSLQEAWRKTSSFSYMENDWDAKSPNQFEKDGGGNCRDFSTYMVYLLGSQAYMIIIERKDELTNHAIVHYDGHFVEPQIYGRYVDMEKLEYKWVSYYETLCFATGFGMY